MHEFGEKFKKIKSKSGMISKLHLSKKELYRISKFENNRFFKF